MELRSIEAIARALKDASVRYLVVGGLAVNAHGFERQTRGIDLVIGLEPENVIRGLRALIAIGYQPAIPVSVEDFANASLRETWRNEKNMIVLKLWSDIHRRTPVDVFVSEPFDFDREFSQASIQPLSETIDLPILRLDALLQMKREAGRPIDLEDIRTLEQITRERENAAPES